MENDVFAVGILLYKFLSEELDPFELCPSGFALPIQFFNIIPLSEKKIPKNFCELIKDMITAKPGKTMTMEEAYNRFSKALNAHISNK